MKGAIQMVRNQFIQVKSRQYQPIILQSVTFWFDLKNINAKNRQIKDKKSKQ